MSLDVKITKRFDGFTLRTEFTAGNTTAAILGASGCGKSMTLRCIAGIVRPDSGRIVLDGRVLFAPCGWRNWPTACPVSFRAGSSSALHWPAFWRASPVS